MIDIELSSHCRISSAPSGGEDAVSEAAALLSKAEFPVLLNGAGVVIGGAIEASIKLSRASFDAPVCCGYQHNDAFPGPASVILLAHLATTDQKRGWN